MDQDILDSHIYQYETSYLTLQSDTITISTTPTNLQFYAYFESDHQDSIQTFKDVSFERVIPKALTICHQDINPLYRAPHLSGIALDDASITSLYPERCHEEHIDNNLLSFFLRDHRHIMTQQKECMLERPQGHILLQGDILNASEHVMSTTSYMSGVFMSHIALGNTSFHKMTGDHRHPLMLHKMAGLRLYIFKDGRYHILSMPSLFEVGHQHVTWRYTFEDDTLLITLSGHIDDFQTQLTIQSLNHKMYEMMYTIQLVMGPNEWLYDLEMQSDDYGWTVSMPKTSMAYQHYPTLTYALKTSFRSPIQHGEDGVLMCPFTLTEPSTIEVSAAYGTPTFKNTSHEDAIRSGQTFYQHLLHHFNVEHASHDVSSDVTMVYWYAHNALIHYASPHGLEQYNGAAWGTRDVCQGPFEFFSAIQYDEGLRHILKTVYSRQFIDNGDFPQWFMYDKYAAIQAHDAHGDIIYWPLKALAYYLKQTGDLDFLHTKVPYYSIKDQSFTTPVSIYDHVTYQIQTMLDHMIFNLPLYGGGDWDDTLQPANETLKEQMVSGWTAALMIQSLEAFAEEIKDFDKTYSQTLKSHIQVIKEARKTYLLPDGIPAGFVVFSDPQKPTYLLHPKDQETGLSYRLLPFIRSMIAGLTTEEETQRYVHIIQSNLSYPDGIRLMDHPVTYSGGHKKYFNRAETAANFGREIGLQYVHAHIRYIEAMLAIGNYKDAYEGLQVIHPIQLIHTVKHALPRQRNTYFSSSDGNFYTRYEAKENFHTLKDGTTNVKGGWRIYSSGPGILIHQMIVGMYGISRHHGSFMLNPKLPETLKDTRITFKRDA